MNMKPKYTKKEIKTTVINYGICKNYAGKYFLVIRGKGMEGLIYSSKKFALRKAHSFARSMYYDFADQHFRFENLGELKELNYTKETSTAETHFIPVGMEFIVNVTNL